MTATVTSRNKLPATHKRPAKTAALKRFDSSVQAINDFYWAVSAGFLALDDVKAADRLSTVLAPMKANWAISPGELSNRTIAASTFLPLSCLVIGVTSYEEYLGEIVSSVLAKQPLPDKKIRLQVDLGQIPSAADAASHLRELWIAHKRAEVLGEGYSKRANALEKVLSVSVANADPPFTIDYDGISIALETRNCIVHSGGIVDQRTLTALSGLGPGITIGLPFPMNQSVLFRCLKAMLDHADALDVLIRIQEKHARRTRRKR